ncbi:MAG: restriction endonuclease subunit S [Streptococcus mitis]|jgi:hsdS|nr:restriction endonuclease subunit S [Streptococcus mitis]
MTEERKAPAIRFKEFSGQNAEAWEQRKLGEVADITMGQSPKSENYTDNPSNYILVQGNADMKDGKVFPRVWTTQVTKQGRVGDLILSVRAPVGDIGKTDYNVVLGRGVAAIRGNEFIFQTLSKMKQNGYWNKLSTGSTFESINSNDIKSATILIPSSPEQKAIGSFFQELNQLITLQQRKLEKSRRIKIAMLQKMFPENEQTVPAIRFKEFSGQNAKVWELRKLEECTEISAGGDIDKSKLLNNGKYPVIANALTDDGIIGYYNDSYRIEAPAVTVTGRGNVGVAKARNVNFTPVVRLLSLRSDYDVIFLENAINTKNIVIESTGVPQLTVPQLGSYKIFLPSLPEQRAIGSFFQELDQLIILQQRRLDKLQNMKKALLEQMMM